VNNNKRPWPGREPSQGQRNFSQPRKEATMQTVAHITPFEQVLLYTARRAAIRYPSTADRGRIQKALRIIVDGNVQLHADGTATIQSQSEPGTTYHVNGACQCRDFSGKADNGRCKHRYARSILRAAQHSLDRAYFATHLLPDGDVQGFAFPIDDGQEWVFLPEDSQDIQFLSMDELVFGGHYATWQAQRQADGSLVAKACGY